MHPEFELNFNQASDKYNKGDFKDAIKILNSLLSVTELTIKEKLAAKFLKTLCLTQDKAYEEALNVADSIIEESMSNNLDLQLVDGFLAKAAILNDQRKLKESLKQIKKAEKIIKNQKDSSSNSLRIRESNLLKIKGWSYLYNNQIRKSLDCFEERIDINRRLGDLLEIGEALNDTGIALSMLEELNLALKFHEQALKIYQELGYDTYIATTSKYIVDIYQNKGESSRAEEYDRIYQVARNKFTND